jgi:hypothetical protein
VKREPIHSPSRDGRSSERPIGSVTKDAKLGDALKVGTRLRNIRGEITKRAAKAPPITLPRVSLGTPRDDSS